MAADQPLAAPPSRAASPAIARAGADPEWSAPQPIVGRKRDEIRALTGLRGLAALDVALGHYNLDDIAWIRFLDFHNAAVDVFFCLSCFTLCLVYCREDRPRIDWRGYAVARFARIYPLYFVATALTITYTLAWNVVGELKPSVLIEEGVRQIFVLGSWPLPGPGGNWLGPAWSVSIEVFCYILVFPTLVKAMAARRAPSWLIVCLLVAIAVAVASVVAIYFDPAVYTANDRPARTEFAYYVPLLRGCGMFICGWLAFRLWARRDRLAAAVASLNDAIAVGALAIVLCSGTRLIDAEFVIVLAPFLILGIAEGGSVTARLLASAPFHALGRISYSLYLTHFPLRFVLMREWPSVFGDAHPVLSLQLAAALALSTVTYWTIERPARRMIRSWFGLRPA